MKKKVILIILSIMLILCLAGCNSSKDSGIEKYPPSVGKDENIGGVILDNASDRKIIYYVDLEIRADDIKTTANNILSKIKTEQKEFIEKQSQSEEYLSFVLRIKTDRLDEFLASISTEGNYVRKNIKSEDISTRYYDRQAQIDTLKASRARYVILLEKATIEELIIINDKIDSIDFLLKKLSNEQNIDIGLVDYSVVSVNISKEFKQTTLSFGEKVKEGFKNGLAFFSNFFEYALLTLIVLLPFLTLVGIGIGIFLVIRKKRKANKAKNPNNNNTPKASISTNEFVLPTKSNEENLKN